jgi:hypothetical protein
MCVERFLVVDGDPGKRFADITGVGRLHFGGELPPIVVHAQGSDPTWMRLGHAGVPANFDPVVEWNGGGLQLVRCRLEARDVGFIEEKYDSGKAFGLPVSDCVCGNRFRRDQHELCSARTERCQKKCESEKT